MNPYYLLITSLCKKPKREKEKSNAESYISGWALDIFPKRLIFLDQGIR